MLALSDRGRVQGHDVRLLEQLVERHEGHAHLGGLLGRKVGIVPEDARLERAGARGHARSHLPEPDDADGLAGELGADELRFLPFSRRHRGGGLRDPAQEREQDAEGVLDRGDDVAGRRVQHQNAARRGGRDVHVVDAHAGPPDDGEARSRREEGRVDARGAAHEERVGVGERGEELLASGAGEVHDLVPRAAQKVEARRRNLLGDDDAAHAAASPALASSAARRASSDARSTSPMWPMRNVEAFHFP